MGALEQPGGTQGYLAVKQNELIDDMSDWIAYHADPREVFLEFTNQLRADFDISRAMLVIREENEARFVALASWNRGKFRRNLSLRMPTVSSLFQRVAEDGQMYMESFTEFFNGNLIERNLLLDDDTKSFLLKPIKHDATVVGLVGFSSDDPNAFVTMEDGWLDPILRQFAELIARYQVTQNNTK
ncbi:MAG: hypothetical protein KKA42_12480 [candidate division Zixibacteria bacterium]|nr:hypothetical protein [candidate division Zixibacteria bacterium]